MTSYDTAVLLMVLGGICALGLYLHRQISSGKTSLETAQQIALSVISRVSLALLTDAERTYGGGTGELKMSACMEKLIELLPASVVELVPKAFLQENLEKALEIAKTKWTKNPRLLNQKR